MLVARTLWRVAVFKMIEKPKTVIASASLVKEFVDMEPAPYDRPLSERRLQVYERILKANLFRPVVWASALCYETNCTYRVNGKHTSVLLSKQEPLPTFYVTVERWGCDTLKDVGSLYNTYDSNISTRSAGDINASFAATMPELKDVPHRLINLAVTAAAFLKWDDTTLRKVPQAERAEELLERGDFVKWLQEVIQTTGFERNSLSKHLLRSPVICAMMATYDRCRTVAKDFWVKVRDESPADRNDPTRTLARFLIRAVMTGGDMKGNRQAVGHREMYVKCLHAWNAYRAGESTSLAYHANSPIPKVSK